MCFYLTVALPADQAEQVGRVFGRGFRVFDTPNPSIASALPAGFVQRVVITGQCSCDLYRRPGEPHPPSNLEHLRKRYERNGWSESRIARAIDQASASRSRRPSGDPGLRKDVIAKMVELGASTRAFAIAVHHYNDLIDVERIEHLRTAKCSLNQLPVLASGLADDLLLLVTNR